MERVLEAQHQSLDGTDALASAWSEALLEGTASDFQMMVQYSFNNK